MSAVPIDEDVPTTEESTIESDETDPVEGEDEESEQEEELDVVNNVHQLLPVHAAPNTGKNALVVKRGRGRPRKVERMPTTSDLEYHTEMSALKAKFIGMDPVVVAASGRADALQILNLIKLEVAKEAAALHFQRIENEKFGKDTAQVSSRRIEALGKIATIELEVKKLGADLLDLRNEKFQRVFKLWVDRMREAATEVLSPEQIDLLFNRFSTSLEGWEDKAMDSIR